MLVPPKRMVTDTVWQSHCQSEAFNQTHAILPRHGNVDEPVCLVQSLKQRLLPLFEVRFRQPSVDKLFRLVK